MKRRSFLVLVLLSLTLSAYALSMPAFSTGWETVVEGIDYQEFHLTGPKRVYVARMDRSNQNLILETSIAQGKLSGGKETVSEMADRYDQSLSAWAPGPDKEDTIFPVSDGRRPTNPILKPWGPRNDVVVAINGTFYNPDTGVTSGGLVHSGWYVKTYGDLGGSSGFAWKQSRTAFIGECTYHPPEKQILTNLTTGKTIQIDNINFRDRGEKTILFTPQFDKQSNAGSGNAEVRIQLTRPLGVRPYPDMTVGIVREVQFKKGPIQIPFDQIVISTYGAGESRKLLDTVRVGDVVGISLEITSLESDCENALNVGWANTYASLSGSFYFLKDGKIQSFDDNLGATQRHPRTAICYNDEYIFFVVVDGRQKNFSIGMTSDELAMFCRDDLGARWGINQDGGGSSTMWVNGKVMNSPSDGAEREVANGIMMVVVEPMERSDSFQVRDKVKTLQSTGVYFGPGTNFALRGTVPEDASGVILPHMNDTNGVLAKGTHWWWVDIGNKVGWVSEDALVLVERSRPNMASQRAPGFSFYLSYVDTSFLPW
ncbi:MAG: hypothetical protein GTO14_18930 [Anaerolineales bacterium]|nr:hypothetical protein [Anaerolineales bacterium]